MKTFSAFVALVLAGTTAASASMLAYNTEEYILRGSLDIDSAAGTAFDVEAGYGYFIQDYLETGGLIGYFNNDFLSSIWIGGFGEYNFETETDFVPFAGSQLRLLYSQFDIGDNDESNMALALGVYAGAKYFIYENLAVSARLLLEGATDDVYAEDDDVSNVDVRIDFGLRIFF